jgi:SAM-dependent methyltransferase
MPSSQDGIYSSTDYHKQKHGASSKASSLITSYRGQKFSALIKGEGLDILEVGVGPGWNLLNLPARRRVGMDVTSAYADHLKNSGVEFVTDLSELSGQQFDVVIVSHVMEHLLEPAKTLAELGELLKPEGNLLAIVPLEAPVRRVSPADSNHHLFSWNVQTFNEFLTACGYSVRTCKVKRYGFDRFAAELAVRLGGGSRLYGLLLLLLRLIRPGWEIQALADRNAQRSVRPVALRDTRAIL